MVSYNPLRSSKVDTFPLKELVDNWQTIFIKGPPNAGFVFYHEEHNSFSEISVVLKNPRLESVDRMISFDIESLEKNFHDDKLEMNAVTLFIDEANK